MKKVLKYLSVTQLMEDVRDMNGVMPVRRFVITTIAAGAGVYGACLLYRINYVLAFVVMLVAVAMIPGLVRNYFRECSEAARFADVDVYNQIINDYNSVFKSKARQVTLRMVPIWAGMCAVVVLLVVMKLWIPALCLAGVMIVLMSTPFTQKKTAVKRVKNGLYCGFTEWLRDLAVNLENKPLLSAVEDLQ